MATAKKQAPKPVERVPVTKKLTRKEKSAANKARYREIREDVMQKVREVRTATIAHVPRKTAASPKPSVKHLGTVGRPRIDVPYTGELDRQLFQLLSVGTSLDTISQLEGMPPLYVMLGWLSDKRHKFSETFTRARSIVVPLYEDRALDIALNPASGIIKITRQALTRDGDVVTLTETQDRDAVERAKLALSAYQWALGWMVPKKHGKLPDLGDQKKNEQLEALFASLKSGPVETA